MPADVPDAEVRQALEKDRQRVLDDPGSAEAWGQLGLCLRAHQFDDEAELCLAEASRLDPDDGRWPYYRGLYAVQYDPDRAVPLLQQALAGKLPPGCESAVRLRLAEALLERNEWAAAEDLFREEWRRHPGDPRTAFGLGLIARARDDPKGAEEYLGVARASPSVRKPAVLALAALYRGRDDPRAAALEQEAAALPSEPPAWPDPLVEQMVRLRVGSFRRGQDAAQLERERRYAEAAGAYLKLTETQPTAANYSAAGLNLARSGDFVRAWPLFDTAVRLDPNDANTRFCLAQALAMQAEVERQRGVDPAKVNERFAAAADSARRATECKPDHAAAYLLWGRALMSRGEPEAALVPLRRGVTCRPEAVNLQLALGEALLESGRREEAEIHLENALKLDPKNALVLRALERLHKGKK
jgi:tetratricopeptide (TPR) repeat protein